MFIRTKGDTPARIGGASHPDDAKRGDAACGIILSMTRGRRAKPDGRRESWDSYWSKSKIKSSASRRSTWGRWRRKSRSRSSSTRRSCSACTPCITKRRFIRCTTRCCTRPYSISKGNRKEGRGRLLPSLRLSKFVSTA